MTKKIVIFAASLIYLTYTVDDSLKTVQLKNIYQKNFRIWHIGVNLHRILFNVFVLIVDLNLYFSSEAREF